MKACFAHDFPMIKDDKGNVYSKGAFPYLVWKRYLKHFDELTILAREGEKINQGTLEVLEYLSLSSGPNVKFVSIPNLSSIKGKILNKKKAKLIIEKELDNVDVLLTRLPSEVGTLAAKVAIDTNIPYLVELVGCPFDALRYYGNLKSKIYAPFSMLQTKSIVKDSKYTIYVTRDYLQKKYPTFGKEINISNVNIKNINKNILNSRVETYKNLSNRTLRIGMIGSLNSKYKGFDRAIKYLSKIKPNFNNYEIYILGGGDKSNFDKVISSNNMQSKVFFEGTRSSGEEVFKWLDKIDLYIHPSLTEGLPRALIEALSRGCLAIGSNRGGIPELLENQYLFNPLDEKSFEKSVDRALSTAELMEEQVNKNIDKAKEYTISRLSKKRDNFIREFIVESQL